MSCSIRAGWPGRVVQRREVVVVVLDLGALGDLEAEPDEDVLDLAPRLGDQVQPAGGPRRVARQRHVDPVLGEAGVELRVLELADAARRSAPRAPAARRSPAWPTLPRSSGGRSPIERSAAVSSDLRPEVADADLLEVLRPTRRRPRPSPPAARIASNVSAIRGHPMSELVQRHGRRHRRVQRVGTVVADRDARPHVSRFQRVRPQPCPLRRRPSRRRGRGARARGASSGASRSSASRVPGSSSARRARGRPREDRAHARPHGLRPVRVGAARPDHDRPVAERVRRADDRADVARGP